MTSVDLGCEPPSCGVRLNDRSAGTHETERCRLRRHRGGAAPAPACPAAAAGASDRVLLARNLRASIPTQLTNTISYANQSPWK